MRRLVRLSSVVAIILSGCGVDLCEPCEGEKAASAPSPIVSEEVAILKEDVNEAEHVLFAEIRRVRITFLDGAFEEEYYLLEDQVDRFLEAHRDPKKYLGIDTFDLSIKLRATGYTVEMPIIAPKSTHRVPLETNENDLAEVNAVRLVSWRVIRFGTWPMTIR